MTSHTQHQAKMAAFTRMRVMMRSTCVSKQSGTGFLTAMTGSSIDRRAHSGRTSDHYRLIAAASVERKPVITNDPTRIEREFGEILEKIEFENSFMSDHEMRHLEDERRKKRFAAGTATEGDLEAAPQTAQDFEDLATEEFQQFRVASRITEADEQGDRRSLKRHLQRHLLLLIRGKSTAPSFSRSFGEWFLPCALHKDGETLKETAERALKEHCGDQLQARILGNAPVGFYRYSYPKKYREEGLVGAKVFFFRGRYVKGNVASEAIDDHCWITREEMEDILRPNLKYLKALKRFTYDERFTYETHNEFINQVSNALLHKMSN